MTDYTEQEINEAVALIKFQECIELEVYKIEQRAVDVVSQGQLICTFDPCNNPNDWTPLLGELQRLGELWISENYFAFHPNNGSLRHSETLHETELGKAICILWLMVNS